MIPLLPSLMIDIVTEPPSQNLQHVWFLCSPSRIGGGGNVKKKTNLGKFKRNWRNQRHRKVGRMGLDAEVTKWPLGIKAQCLSLTVTKFVKRAFYPWSFHFLFWFSSGSQVERFWPTFQVSSRSQVQMKKKK